MARDARGRFAPGNQAAKNRTARAGGRPPSHVRDLARGHTEEAVRVLVAIMQGDAAALDVPSVPVRDRREAARELLDRAWGKPTHMIGGDAEHPIRMTLEDLLHEPSGTHSE